MGKGGFSVNSIDCEGRVVCCMFYMKFTTHFSAATSLKSSKINIRKFPVNLIIKNLILILRFLQLPLYFPSVHSKSSDKKFLSNKMKLTFNEFVISSEKIEVKRRNSN